MILSLEPLGLKFSIAHIRRLIFQSLCLYFSAGASLIIALLAPSSLGLLVNLPQVGNHLCAKIGHIWVVRKISSFISAMMAGRGRTGVAILPSEEPLRADHNRQTCAENPG